MALAKHDQEGVYQLGKTMATNLAATYALKYATNDTAWGERPNGEDYSFPSGHASDSCAGATFIGQRYGWRYGSMANPPIRIVVENGHVTLDGVVNNDVERMMARSLATGFGEFSLTNALKTDAEVERELERL